MDWKIKEDWYAWDYSTKQYRLHILIETDLPVSYLQINRDTFFKDVLIPFFKSNSMCTYKEYYRLTEEQKKAGKTIIEIKNQYKYIFYRLARRFIEKQKLMLEFEVFEQ